MRKGGRRKVKYEKKINKSGRENKETGRKARRGKKEVKEKEEEAGMKGKGKWKTMRKEVLGE